MLNKVVKKKVSKSTTINVMSKNKKRISNSLSTIINGMTKINMISINKKRIQFTLINKIRKIKK